MPMLDWLVGAGIEFSDGGAPEKIEALSESAKMADKAFLDLQKSADNLATSLGAVSAAAAKADEAVSGLGLSFGMAASGGMAAASSASAAATGFRAASSAAAASERAARGAAAGMREYVDAWRATALVVATSGPLVGQQLALRSTSRMALPWTQPLALMGGFGAGVMVNGAPSGPAIPLSGGGGNFPIMPYTGGTPPGWGYSGQRALPSGGRIIPVGASGAGGGGAWIGGGPPPGAIPGGPGGGMTPYLGPMARRIPGTPGTSGAWTPTYLGALPAMPSAMRHFLTHGAVLGGEALLGTGYDALYEAGKLQRELSGIQIGTGAKQSQMDQIRQLAYTISNETAQSVAQSAGVIGVMTSSGINDPAALMRRDPKTGQTFAEIVAKFADVQYLKSGGKVSFEEATKQAIQLAHLHRNYKPEEIAPMLDTVSKLSFMMPDTLRPYLTQAGYFTPILSRLGVPEDQTLILGSFLDRMGLGKGKGGTSVQNFVQALMKPLSLTGHHQAGQINALEMLGIYDKSGKGNPAIFKTDPKTGDSVLDVFGSLQTIDKSIHEQTDHLKGDAKARKERELVGDFQKAFGIQGQRFGLLGDDKGIQVLLGMIHQLNKMPSVDQMQRQYIGNMDSQAVRAWSNFQSLMTEIGTLAIPGVTKGLTDLGDAFHNAQAWMHKHGELEKQVQQGIYNDVVGVEKWVFGHHNDWVALAQDLKSAGKAAQDVAPIIGFLADRIIGTYKTIHDATSPLGWIIDPVGSENARERGIKDQIAQHPGYYKNYFKTHPGSYANAIKYGLDSVPPPNVNVHVDARGMTPEQATKAVKDGTTQALNKALGRPDQRSRAGTSGTIHTSPNQPTVLSVPAYHR